MWQKITLSHPMFHYAKLHKKNTFLSICVGGYTGALFKLASMYYIKQFLIYTLSLKHKQIYRKKIKDLIFIIKKY